MQSARPGPIRLLTEGPRILARHAWAHASSAAVAPLPRIRSVTPGADPNRQSTKAAIYVCYDRWSLIADFITDQLASLAAAGRRITLMVNSPRLPPGAIARLAPHVREIVHRRNIGHDFGGYKDGIARLGDLTALHSLVLMNDSCYGPFSSLAGVEAKAEATGCDLFGITDSWAHRYHLQTYYLWIAAPALRAPAFATFWRTLLTAQPRSMVISHGEIRLTQLMLQAGLRAGALCPYGQAARLAHAAARHLLATPDLLLATERTYLERLAHDLLAGVPLNPTHSFWDVLLTQCGAPFVKRELLRRNPVRIPGVIGWDSVLGQLEGADTAGILRHLQLG